MFINLYSIWFNTGTRHFILPARKATRQLFVCCSKPARTSKQKTAMGLRALTGMSLWQRLIKDFIRLCDVAERHFLSPQAVATCPLFACWLTPKRNSTLLTTTSVNFSRLTTWKLMKSLYFCVKRYTAIFWAASYGHTKIVHWLAKVRFMCLFDKLVRGYFNLKHCFNIFIIFLRMAPIFSSRAYTGTRKFNDYFRNYQFPQSHLVSMY